jgi:hypothetical protein
MDTDGHGSIAAKRPKRRKGISDLRFRIYDLEQSPRPTNYGWSDGGLDYLITDYRSLNCRLFPHPRLSASLRGQNKFPTNHTNSNRQIRMMRAESFCGVFISRLFIRWRPALQTPAPEQCRRSGGVLAVEIQPDQIHGAVFHAVKHQLTVALSIEDEPPTKAVHAPRTHRR